MRATVLAGPRSVTVENVPDPVLPGPEGVIVSVERSFSKTDPLLKALTMKPSEYIRKHVKFTPFPGEDAGYLIRDSGAELYLFSSDYPHAEGRTGAVSYFERLLPPDEKLREAFFGGSVAQLVGL